MLYIFLTIYHMPQSESYCSFCFVIAKLSGTIWKQIFVINFSPHFMKTESSSPHSQKSQSFPLLSQTNLSISPT